MPRDLTGEKFGKLTVIEWDHCKYQGVNKRHYWLCKCECGNTKVVSASNLYRGATRSCGCLRAKKCEFRPQLRGVLRMIKQRCNDPTSKHYKNYGARGINVCAEWSGKDGVSNFVEWAMQSGYAPGLTIDRIDNNKGYSPDNCRWATMKEQSNNKGNNIKITINGETKTLTQWCEHYNVPYNNTRNRYVALGWDIEDALFTPKFEKPISGKRYGKTRGKTQCLMK